MRATLAVLCSFALAACASVPSASKMESAEFGNRPGGGHQGDIRAAFGDLLIDSGSAEFQYGEPEQGWGRDDKGFVYGWVVWTQVNSKNQFGAFTGWHTYKVLTRDGAVHSIYEPTGNDLFGNPTFKRLR
jgi:hypothetical protein